MSDHALHPVSTLRALASDLFEMTKPKVVLLMLITAWVGMALAPLGAVPWVPVLAGTVGIALLAAAGAAFNHILDQHIDQKMARTHRRPVATGRINPTLGFSFATTLTVSGFVVLFVLTNPLTAWLTLFSMVGYALVYTAWLKRSTPQNIVIGGLAGAMPPLLGWTAVTGSITGLPLLLVLIIFAWTPPHFWALAIHRKDDYAKANVPMMPVTHGVEFTRIQVWLYTWLLLAVSMLPVALGAMGGIYAAAALILGARFLQWSFRLLRGQRVDAAWATFKFSITYLLYLFLALLADRFLWHSVTSLISGS
ncbi:heme o synthase [Reinekea blandensis]|uniref:Protoheme IX farnesyltransferase n=1 Tax=Reinekea blandensis MED297 TaxID=314283 RepID=A4BD57_9GAMM|nr:heme o synthase [Reinekea blandensis]EAR09801.1 protoheme IX farnesyltransferase [Reinekea sp. MED297] [Reinekea blandensis MED297]